MSHPAVGERDPLLLHGAESLDGPWTPHPANPIVRGVDRARMAGAPFELGGAPMRPSQHGARRCGHGLGLDRIVVPDDRRHVEAPLGRLVPAPGDGWPGIHSISRAGDVTFVDRLRTRPRAGAGRVLAPLPVPGLRRSRRGEPESLR